MFRMSKSEVLEFEVVPERCLRNEQLEFCLGMSINQTITLIQQNAQILRNIELTYSKKDPLSRDICIYLSNDGIRLFFDPHTQLLRLIEVDNLSRITLKYRGDVFSSPSCEASREKVDEHFGSTHPGIYDDDRRMYVLSWRGLSFCFRNGDAGSLEVTPGFGSLQSLKYDAAAAMRLTRMSIFKGAGDKHDDAQVDMPLSCYCGQNRTVLVEAARRADGTIEGLNTTFITQTGEFVSGRPGDELEVCELNRTVRFGDTVPEVMSALGAPTKVFYKADDKMSIHRGGSKEPMSANPQPHFFFNYFSMGIDVLFDFTTKRVLKFVLHTNTPGHYDFGIYSRCEFSVLVSANDSTAITTSSKYEEDVSSALAAASGGDPPQPVVVSRNSSEDRNPFAPTFCYGTGQLVVEVMENGHIAALTIFDRTDSN